MSSMDDTDKSDIVPSKMDQAEIRRDRGSRNRGVNDVVDQIDRAIIRVLQRDGRTSNTEIGRALGLTETTIRKRIGRLVGDGLVNIVAVPTPAAVGMTTSAIIGISVQLVSLHEV